MMKDEKNVYFGDKIVECLFQTAIDEVAHVGESSVFTVKDLYKGYFWRFIPSYLKPKLGQRFLAYAKNNNTKIKILGKTKHNQQLYVKLENQRDSVMIG